MGIKTRAEVDKLLLVLVDSFMTRDEERYLATCRLLIEYVGNVKRARGLTQMGPNTWSTDPELFSFFHRHRKRGLSNEEIRIKAREAGRRLQESRRRRRHYIFDPELLTSS